MFNIDMLVVGDLCVDLMLYGNVKPNFGQEEKMIDGYTLTLGGSASIFACQVAKLGLKTTVLGNLAKDGFGDLMMKIMTEAGIDCSYINMDAKATGLSMSLVVPGDRSILTAPEEMTNISYEDIPREVIAQTRHLHIASYYLLDKMLPGWKKLIQEIKQNGGTVSIDTNYDPEEKWLTPGLKEILPMVDVFMPNETEICRLMEEDDFEKALAKASAMCPTVVVKCGSKGACCVDHGKRYDWPANKVDVVDTVGAGDTFDGGFLSGYLMGKDIDTCGKMGTFCSAGNIQAAGGVNGQRTLNEVKEMGLC